MGAQENAATVRALNEAFNTRNADAAVALCTPDVEIVNVASGQILSGPDGIRQFYQFWTTAFPDGKALTKSIVADENTAVIEFTGTGTHTGPLAGPAGTIPPTGKTAELQFIEVNEFRQGKVARQRLYFDMMSMLVQLGVVPAPAQVQAGG